jgi:hypothetical protein
MGHLNPQILLEVISRMDDDPLVSLPAMAR